MVEIYKGTYKSEENMIFVDKLTETINHGNIIQIGLVKIDNQFVEDSIDNYIEVLESEFIKLRSNEDKIKLE